MTDATMSDTGLPDAATVAAADHAMRFWTGDDPGAIRIGSEAHKRLFARMLLDTHNPYKPSVIRWPDLDPQARDRLVGLPIWDIAVQTEGRAKLRVQSYAETISDPLLNESVSLNAWEEGRHKEVLSHLVAFYGIVLAPEPAYLRPRDPEWAFLRTGTSECVDSFFAFGLFALAERSGFFPQALVDTFEPVIQEEARHILFFVNWLAWHRANLPWWRRPLFDLKRAAVWLTIAWDRLQTARDVGGKGSGGKAGAGAPKADQNFTATGHKAMGIEVGPRELFALCIAENERRMAGYDARLLRPTFVPRLVGLVLRLSGRGKPLP